MAEFIKRPARSRIRVALIVVAAASALSACASRDSINVGSIPDDYRTNHPIMIAEKEFKLDLAVGSGDRGMTNAQKQSLEGFLAGYDRSAKPTLGIMKPVGSKNEYAADAAAQDFAAFARRNGVDGGRIVITAYDAGSPEISAPVRVAYINVAAQTGRCGRWPEDLANTADNKHYANFGCAYQNNLAAQVANPNDFLGPRKPSEIDAERRAIVIDDYRGAAGGWAPETEY